MENTVTIPALVVQNGQPSGTQDREASVLMTELKDELSGNIKRLKLKGWISLAVTLVIALLVYFDIKTSLDQHLTYLNDAKRFNQVLTYLMFRSSALGVVATTVLVLGVRLTVASFDQATRFTKRKLATSFLDYLYARHADKLPAEVSLAELMGAFEAWNKTVESAFSGVKTDAAAPAKLPTGRSKKEDADQGN